jgi:membrane associated rhomboid family serine protease
MSADPANAKSSEVPVPTSGRTLPKPAIASHLPPPVTLAVCLTYVGVSLLAWTLPQEAILRWLAPDAFHFWEETPRSLYTLASANLVHLEGWHLALNLVALFFLGRSMEPVIGSRSFAWLLLGAGLTASGTQLAIFGNLGIGGSGMAYGLFGFGVVARRGFSELRRVFTLQTSAVWVGWFLACWIALRSAVANGGHLGGLLFGLASGASAEWLSRPRVRRLVQVGVSALAVLAGTFSIWHAGWWAAMGVQAHRARNYELAIESYTESLRRDPTQTWVRANLIRAEAWSGHPEQTRAALEDLRRSDPAKAEVLLEELKRFGRAPWAP